MNAAERGDLLDVIDAVFAVNGGVIRAGDAMGRAAGITAAQWQVLGLLEHGADSVAGVARRRGLRRQSVQDTANRLVRAGLADRRANPADRRAPLLSITAAGGQALADLSPSADAWLTGLGQNLEHSDVRTALAVLGTLRERLDVPPRDTPNSEAARR